MRRRSYVHDKKCTWCGTPFKAKSNKGRYCSDRCKLMAYRNRKKIAETIKG